MNLFRVPESNLKFEGCHLKPGITVYFSDSELIRMGSYCYPVLCLVIRDSIEAETSKEKVYAFKPSSRFGAKHVFYNVDDEERKKDFERYCGDKTVIFFVEDGLVKAQLDFWGLIINSVSMDFIEIDKK